MDRADDTRLLYLGFDDTDTKDSPRGTGRTIRDFCDGLGQGYRLLAVLRHQLPRLASIPYTSNNSAACAVLEAQSPDLARPLFDAAADFLAKETPDGSDPGVCLSSRAGVGQELVSFALACNAGQVSQAQAMAASAGTLLAGIGGTRDGIIGAAAAVGLTRHGWCGRFIELGPMRALPEVVSVAALEECGIQVVSVDRDPLVPLPADQVTTGGWLRPSLWGGRPVLQVLAAGPGRWSAALTKRAKTAA